MNHIYRLLLTTACLVCSQLAIAQQVELNLHASGFTKPLGIENAGDSRLFIVEQAGRIKIINSDGNTNSTAFLDIRNIVNDGQNEQGLLGLAFHPDYTHNGYFYLNYTASDGSTQISRFSVDGGNPDVAVPESELQLLNIPQPFGNHNGGDLNFGPDGYLYIGMGDGGSGGDPGNRAQNTKVLLGKMLRIDVNSGSPYGIPSTNPFVSDPNTLNEIWAMGLRNPWRFSFDAQTGDMWIADVGQNKWEEIDFQPASSNGGENYGWRCYEGNATYNTSGACPQPGSLTFPIYEFSQSGTPGGCSVTGGVVYRGSDHPSLTGHYLFSDYCGGWIMSIYNNGGSWKTINHGKWPGSGFSSFGEDVNGEVYVAGIFDGKIYKIGDPTSDIREYNKNMDVRVYPNPFNDQTSLLFKYDANKKYKLSITDTAGKLVKTINNISQGEVIIDMKNMDSGMYIFRILSNGILSGQGKLMLK